MIIILIKLPYLLKAKLKNLEILLNDILNMETTKKIFIK